MPSSAHPTDRVVAHLPSLAAARALRPALEAAGIPAACVQVGGVRVSESSDGAGGREPGQLAADVGIAIVAGATVGAPLGAVAGWALFGPVSTGFWSSLIIAALLVTVTALVTQGRDQRRRAASSAVGYLGVVTVTSSDPRQLDAAVAVLTPVAVQIDRPAGTTAGSLPSSENA